MRVSQFLAPTLREVPAEAEVISHILMLRAGFIRKAASGIYTYLPLAQRVLKKISTIIREEMDVKGGQELMLPIIQPAELWQESGRWDVYGPELFRLKDRHCREFALGPTHEEIITDLVRTEIRSYKQMPMLLYQMQNKYRDERRPRFGLMRGREFIMKDLYSFDRDEEGLNESYRKMYDAYSRIFTRCGLEYRPVEADSGAIGGSDTHEFMVIAESGEAAIVYCTDCDYAANVEKAEACCVDTVTPMDMLPKEEVETPDAKTVSDVTQFLNIGAEQLIKTLIFETEKDEIVALIRGDRELNEIKLQKVVEAVRLDMADAQTVLRMTGAEAGYVGPVGLKKVVLVADPEVMQLVNAVCGANKTGFHLINVNPHRDFKPDLIADIRMVQAGEPCPKCKGNLAEARGIEVGQVFKLGTKYSKALGAKYLDEKGKEQYIVMGCYGIGVTRTMAAAIEQNHDSDGIIWPMSIAPYQVVLVLVNTKDEGQSQIAEQLYDELRNVQVEVIMDDRNERPGVKFKDADLIGYPIRVTVGKRATEDGVVEVRLRKNGENLEVPPGEIVKLITDIIQRELGDMTPGKENIG